MIDSRVAYTILIALVALQRLAEMRLSRRNARSLLAEGAVEAGRDHLGTMIAMHAAFLVSAPLEVWALGRSTATATASLFFALFVSAQSLRLWAIRTLGRRWSIRVLVVPESRPVATGPFRLVRHPNYLAVAVEIAALPLIHGAWMTALVFSLANFMLLRRRIRCEEDVLSEIGGYAPYAASRGRFLPGAGRR